MGNCCEGESKRNANGAGRSARKRGGQYLQNESTPQHRVEIKDYKKRSKRELIAILEASESDRKSEKEKYQKWSSDANNYYAQELEKARQQIRKAENNLEAENQKNEQRERQNKDKYKNEIQVARQKTEEAEKKLADATKRTDLDRQKFLDEKSKLQRENKQLQDEKESLLSRYSAIAAAKLTDGNANIADLSDENRPTKISEMYSELYDNEWTDAFVVLTKDEKRSEKDACLTLAAAFYKAYDVCKVKAKEDLGNVKEALTVFYECKELPQETLKQMKDQRKRLFHNHSQTLMKKYMEQVGDIFQDEDDKNSDAVGKFLMKCVQVCWLMAIQDPQVFVDTNLKESGKHFDTERYKAYTKSGSYIDFIVWPALYLHEGGGMLMKGIAQATSKPSPDYENVDMVYRQNPDGETKIPPETLLDHPETYGAINASGIPKVAENESLKMETNLADTTDSGRKSATPKTEKYSNWQRNNKVTILSVKI